MPILQSCTSHVCSKNCFVGLDSGGFKGWQWFMFAFYNSATSFPVAVKRKVLNAVKAALEWWVILICWIIPTFQHFRPRIMPSKKFRTSHMCSEISFVEFNSGGFSPADEVCKGLWALLNTNLQLFFRLRSNKQVLEVFLAVSRGKPSCKFIIANGTTSFRNRTFNFKEMNVALEWWLIWNFNSVQLLGKLLGKGGMSRHGWVHWERFGILVSRRGVGLG